MDRSKQYTKMCEKAEEIQGLWKPTVADWYWNKVGNINWVRVDRHPTGRHINSLDIDYNEEPNFVWLPRQDQLQEMVDFKPHYDIDSKKNARYSLNTFTRFCEWGYGSSIFVGQPKELFTSMEQLWLAFIMKEKYNKVWDGHS